jgi:hypothetical protein
MSEPESREALSEALQLVEKTQVAIGKIRVQVDSLARLMLELAKINAVFETVADRLAVQGFGSGSPEAAAARRDALAPLVKELAELARQTSQGTREIRKELRAQAVNASSTAIAVRQTENALGGLAEVLKSLLEQISERAPRTVPVRSIEIETRVSGSTQMTVAALAKAVAAGVWKLEMPKTGGYKN